MLPYFFPETQTKVGLSVSADQSGNAFAGNRLLSVDILRALAALLVVAGHIVQTSFPVHYQWLEILWVTLAQGGVGLFFVVSGFCIHLPLARADRTGVVARVKIQPFFKRRFIRLYPVHFIVLVVSAICATAMTINESYVSLLSEPTPVQFGLHIVMLHCFSRTAFFSINAVLWTLAFETHFYLLYPFYLSLRQRFGTISPIFVVLLLAGTLRIFLAYIKPELNETDIFLNNVGYRWWEWLLGCLIAEIYPNFKRVAPWRRVVLLMTAAILLGVILEIHGYLWIRAFVWPILFGSILLVALLIPDVKNIIAVLLGGIGLASYSLYLTHPIALHIATWIYSHHEVSDFLKLGIDLLAISMLTFLSYFLLERPLSRIARQTRILESLCPPSGLKTS